MDDNSSHGSTRPKLFTPKLRAWNFTWLPYLPKTCKFFLFNPLHIPYLLYTSWSTNYVSSAALPPNLKQHLCRAQLNHHLPHAHQVFVINVTVIIIWDLSFWCSFLFQFGFTELDQVIRWCRFAKFVTHLFSFVRLSIVRYLSKQEANLHNKNKIFLDFAVDLINFVSWVF